jgi:hypothetical protein
MLYAACALAGTCFDLLKWKPIKHQTIDFRVDVKFRQRIG